MAALGRLPCFNLQVMAGGNPGIYGAGQRPAQAQRRGPASVCCPVTVSYPLDHVFLIDLELIPEGLRCMRDQP